MNRQVRCAGLLALAVVLQGHGEVGRADDRDHGDHGRRVSGGPLRQPCGMLAAELDDRVARVGPGLRNPAHNADRAVASLSAGTFPQP